MCTQASFSLNDSWDLMRVIYGMDRALNRWNLISLSLSFFAFRDDIRPFGDVRDKFESRSGRFFSRGYVNLFLSIS